MFIKITFASHAIVVTFYLFHVSVMKALHNEEKYAF